MNLRIYIQFILFALYGCVGTDVIDDIVPEKLEITNPIMSLKVGESYDLMYRYLNSVGMPDSTQVRWETDNATAMTINENGQLSAILEGQAIVSIVLVENSEIMDQITVASSDETVVVPSGSDGERKSGTIASTSSYALKGDFEISNIDGGVEISLAANYVASEALPGLYVYLSNNPTTVSGALEIGAVTVFSGAHAYNVLGDELSVDTYAYLLYFCKPFNVKVGHGEILD